jgi:hypothetical protein
LEFDLVEFRFLYWRLRDVSGIADQLLHNIHYTQYRSFWDNRREVTSVIITILNVIDQCKPLEIRTELHACILIDAIENNPYFADLPLDSKRRNSANIAKVKQLALKVQQRLGRPVHLPKLYPPGVSPHAWRAEQHQPAVQDTGDQRGVSGGLTAQQPAQDGVAGEAGGA